jgi:teichuronic acid biosynthesis glycosyltransferase TuaC
MGDDILGSNRSDGSVTFVSKMISSFNIFLARRFYDHSIVKSSEMYSRINIPGTTIIPNGVDLAIYNYITKKRAREFLAIDLNVRLILFVSDPSRPEKNFSLARESVSLLKEEKSILLPVYDKSQEELAYYYNAADLVLLSSFHEGSPNIVKEAMACNCPVVSSDVGDSKWLFGSTEGYFITGFNPVETAQNIEKAIDFRDRFVCTRGRERIIELGLDSDSVADRLMEVYYKVLN